MVKNMSKNNNNSSNSLVFGRWPQTKTGGSRHRTQVLLAASQLHKLLDQHHDPILPMLNLEILQWW